MDRSHPKFNGHLINVPDMANIDCEAKLHFLKYQLLKKSINQPSWKSKCLSSLSTEKDIPNCCHMKSVK